jgi:hypothetical protein
VTVRLEADYLCVVAQQLGEGTKVVASVAADFQYSSNLQPGQHLSKGRQPNAPVDRVAVGVCIAELALPH